MWFVPIFAVMTSYQFMIVCSSWCHASATEEFCFDLSCHMSVRKCVIGCVMECDFDKGSNCLLMSRYPFVVVGCCVISSVSDHALSV